MEKVPQEVFSQIISFLPIYHKLICIHVCKKWYDLITATNLYSNLVFKNWSTFNQAMNFFSVNQHMGKQVQDVNITDLTIGISQATSIATHFPNVDFFKWIEFRHINDNMDTAAVFSAGIDFTSNYREALASWKDVKSIVEWPRHHPPHIATNLLASITCTNLRRLEVSFRDYTMGYCHRDKLELLLKNIHNAPSLEQLTFGETAIILDDIDWLHINLPKLKEIKLETVYLYTFDERAARKESSKLDDTTQQNQLESFSISFYPNTVTDSEALGFENSINNWVAYIGDNYSTTLQHLQIEYLDYEYADLDKRNVEPFLLSTISRLKNLKSYAAMNFYPLSKNVLNAMATSGIQLNKLKLQIEEDSETQGIFDLLKQPSSISSITSIHTLELCKRYFPMDALEVKQGLLSFSTHLPYLRHLSINNDASSADPQLVFNLLIGILQNLTFLETLHFGLLELHRLEGYDHQQLSRQVAQDQLDIAKKKGTTITSRLKKLSIIAQAKIRKEEMIVRINSIFALMLKYCPKLEQFEMEANFYIICSPPPRIDLKLDFSENPKLKLIKITKLYGGCKGYTFSHAPGKQWKNDHTLLAQPPPTADEEERRITIDDRPLPYSPPFLLNLTWCQDRKVELELADCTT